MDESKDVRDLEEAIRHCRAGLKAIEAAYDHAKVSGAVYPTHLHLAAVELAHAIELGMKVVLRNG
jgi:hypothetical protein